MWQWDNILQFQIISQGKEIIFASQLVSFTPFNIHKMDTGECGRQEILFTLAQQKALWERFRWQQGKNQVMYPENRCIAGMFLRWCLVEETCGHHMIRELIG